MRRIIPCQLADGKFIRQERRSPKYLRRFKFAVDACDAGTKALFKDGAVRLRVSADQHGPDYLVQQALLPRDVFRVFQITCGQ